MQRWLSAQCFSRQAARQEWRRPPQFTDQAKVHTRIVSLPAAVPPRTTANTGSGHWGTGLQRRLRRLADQFN